MFGLLGYLGARTQRAAINASSSASHPAGLRLSHRRLRRLCPSLYFKSGMVGSLRCFFANGLEQRYNIQDMLLHGDARAAVVLSTAPLRIASYSDDLDGVCVLAFDDWLAAEHRLSPSERLLTVLNSWSVARPVSRDYVAADIAQGSRADRRFVNFWPLIADFLTDDTDRLSALKAEIDDAEYRRCHDLGQAHLTHRPSLVRSGRPDRSMKVAGQPWIVVRW
jgi:hypothetical protein